MVDEFVFNKKTKRNPFHVPIYDRIVPIFGNLKLQYTDLTSGDLRFCALLRLNMPTKEIAKLLNISTRGVDAARYRLRKKFNLLPEESLTDFLINFK